MIGSFCSIAEGDLIVLGNHRHDSVSSYPFGALARHWNTRESRSGATPRHRA